MNKSALLTIVAVVMLGIVVFIYSRDAVKTPIPTPTPTVEEETTPFPTSSGMIPMPSTVPGVTVTYSDSGYMLSTVTIKRGEKVFFENKSSGMMWTASAVHPTHKAYPGSGIEKCGDKTNSLSAIFDACEAYDPGESWAFVFNESGTWKYHNHLKPSHTGTIVVQ